MNAPAGTTRHELPRARTADAAAPPQTEPPKVDVTDTLASTERATAYATAAATLLTRADR